MAKKKKTGIQKILAEEMKAELKLAISAIDRSKKFGLHEAGLIARSIRDLLEKVLEPVGDDPDLILCEYDHIASGGTADNKKFKAMLGYVTRSVHK